MSYEVLSVLSKGRQEATTALNKERQVMAEDVSKLSLQDKLDYFKQVAQSVGRLAGLLCPLDQTEVRLDLASLGSYRLRVSMEQGFGVSGSTSARWGGLGSRHTAINLEKMLPGVGPMTQDGMLPVSGAENLLSVRTVTQLSPFGYSCNESHDGSKPGDAKLTRELVDILEAERTLGAIAAETVGIYELFEHSGNEPR